MKKFLFLINYYNDVDHTAPLMKEFMEQGHSVSVVCLTQYKLTTDLRIKQLANYRGFRIHRFALLPAPLAEIGPAGVANVEGGHGEFPGKSGGDQEAGEQDSEALHRCDEVGGSVPDAH
mgnify:CR=1 FL=1